MEKVFGVINALVEAGVIETYAIGGAIAAIFYTEPVLTDDLDVYIPVSIEDHGLVSLGPLYEHLASLGYHPKGEFIDIEGWNVQFLPVPDSLTDEAMAHVRIFDVEEQRARVLAPEYLIAISLKTGRAKDFARISTFEDLADVDWNKVQDLIERFKLEGQWRKFKTLD